MSGWHLNNLTVPISIWQTPVYGYFFWNTNKIINQICILQFLYYCPFLWSNCHVKCAKLHFSFRFPFKICISFDAKHLHLIQCHQIKVYNLFSKLFCTKKLRILSRVTLQKKVLLLLEGEQNVDWHVGLYTFAIDDPWWRHLGAGICRSWYMS